MVLTFKGTEIQRDQNSQSYYSLLDLLHHSLRLIVQIRLLNKLLETIVLLVTELHMRWKQTNNSLLAQRALFHFLLNKINTFFFLKM